MGTRKNGAVIFVCEVDIVKFPSSNLFFIATGKFFYCNWKFMYIW